MAGGRHGDARWPLVVAGAVAAVWGFRLELALVLVVVIAHGLLSRAVGGVAAWLLVVGVTGALLAVGGCRRWLRRVLLAARVRRRWRRAWIDCGLARVRAGRVVRVPAGELVRVRASRGSSLDAVAARAEQLAVCLKLRELRVTRDRHNAATGTVTLVRRDALGDLGAQAWPHSDATALSLWDPIPVGVDELSHVVSIALPERNVLVGGEPGAGKSVALSLLVASAALDPSARLWLLDGKLVELSAWAPCAERLAGPDIDDAIELLREARAVMEERYRVLLANGARKITAGDGLALHLVACDELAFYLTCEDRKQRALFAELLRDLVARGRAAGVIVCAATQKPASDVVPSALRDLFGFRLALRCNTPQASDTILGQGWATLGHNAASIAPRAARHRAAAGRGRRAGPYPRLSAHRPGRRRDRRTGGGRARRPRMAGRANPAGQAMSCPRVRAEPFVAWCEHQLRAIANRSAIGIIPLDPNPQPNSMEASWRGARALLAARLGIDVRTLWTYLHARERGNGDGSLSRYAVEDMLARAGEDFYAHYPEYAHERDIVLEPDVFCPRCREMTTPLDGICLWCKRIVVRDVVRDSGAWLAARAQQSPPAPPGREQPPTPAREPTPVRDAMPVREPAARRHTGRLLWRRPPAREAQQRHREGRDDLAA